MSANDRIHDRIRWHCRRGLLELDLVLNAFVQRYLADLQSQELDVLLALLERPDPELLDFLMGHCEPDTAAERDLVSLMRSVNVQPIARYADTSAANAEARTTIHHIGGVVPSARN